MVSYLTVEEDILEYQVDVQHPYMIEIKNIVQKASEVATHQEEFYFKRARLIKEQRKEYIEKLYFTANIYKIQSYVLCLQENRRIYSTYSWI